MPGIDYLRAAFKPVGRSHCDTAYNVVADMLSYFDGKRGVALLHRKRVVYVWQVARFELNVHNRSHNLRDYAF